MPKLTFLLPLRDRANYTKIWLKHNLSSEFNYYVADGSIGDENKALFDNLGFPSLTYVRYPKDLSTGCFVRKMLHSVQQVSTKYVMTCDNDDFINFNGIKSSLAALDNNPEAVCAGGPIYGVYEVPHAVSAASYGLPLKILDAAPLSGKSGFDALVQLFSQYRYMWYSLFRTPIYQEIWTDINRLQISTVHLVEILQTELAFCHGKYIQVPDNHYVRLQNPPMSCAKDAAVADGPHSRKIFFDEEYRSQVIRMSEHVAGLVGVSLQQLLNEMTNYYVAGNTHQSDSFVARMSARLVKLHEIVPRKLGITFPIETGIRVVNGLQTVRNTLGA